MKKILIIFITIFSLFIINSANINVHAITLSDYVQIADENDTAWINEYNKVNSFDFISYEESLKLHTILDNVKERILFDKNIGEEKRISDEVLLWYEIVIKKINVTSY